MKGFTFSIVLILFTTLLTSESFKIKRDLTYSNKENALNSPIILNDEDLNDIEKREGKKRTKKSINHRLTSLEQILLILKNLLEEHFDSLNSRLNTVAMAG